MSETTPPLLLRIRQEIPNLAGKYRKIADFIIANPDQVIPAKVKDISRICSCDDAQVIRFCQKIGFDGFSSLKNAIASEFLPASMRPEVNLDESKSNFDLRKEKFFSDNKRVFRDTINLLNEESVDQARSIICKASKVFLHGVGASGLVAQDAQIKLLRLGFNAIFNINSDFNKMLLGLSGKNDVILAISNSGESEPIVEMVQLAKKNNVKIIAITNYLNSTLATEADIALLTSCDENSIRLGPMTSRLAQLFVIDFIMLDIALHNIEKCGDSILRTHQAIFEKRKTEK